jgi:hypothetical protein
VRANTLKSSNTAKVTFESEVDKGFGEIKTLYKEYKKKYPLLQSVQFAHKDRLGILHYVKMVDTVEKPTIAIPKAKDVVCDDTAESLVA